MPSPTVTITLYAPEDELAVISLWHRCFPPEHLVAHNDPRTAIAQKLAYQPDLFFVAKLDGHIIGTTMAGYDGHRGWLYSVAVAPTHRRQRIGRQLLEHAECALIALGAKKINLQVRQTNAEVIAFYQRCGYSLEPNVSMGKRI
jgi:ribosomal protein S18 acetylase RimI-like enzyme